MNERTDSPSGSPWGAADYKFLAEQSSEIRIPSIDGDPILAGEGYGVILNGNKISMIVRGEVTEVTELPNGPLSGDTISLKVSGAAAKISIRRNGILLPQRWSEYPRWWLANLRVWWLTKTHKLTGSNM